jgi:prepilin-type N-terminal cleavage/methylation domain-containing protein
VGGRPQATPPGFTLLEALVASSLFALVMAAVYLMYETNQATLRNGEARATIQQHARIALDDITAAIRAAGAFHPDPLCRPASSGEAVRVATDDTLSLHAGYRDPDPAGAPNQDCNTYVTFSLRGADGVRDATLRRETRLDPWDRGQLVEAPLAQNVTRLVFRYYDAYGNPIPTTLPEATAPDCPDAFPAAYLRAGYALDAQGPVVEAAVPAPVAMGSQRDQVRAVRVEIMVEANTAPDVAGCFRRNVGGTTQAFTLVSEGLLRGVAP